MTLKGSGSTGKMALVDKETPMMFSRNVGLVRLKLENQELAEFLYAYFSCRHGQRLIDRGVTGGTGQLTLPTGYLKRFPIPNFPSLSPLIKEVVVDSKRKIDESEIQYKSAEQTLLKALGLEDWQPPEPLTYTRRASEALAAKRIDSDFFAPARYAALEKLAETPHRLLRDCCDPIRELFDPQDSKGISEVRNFDVTDALKPSLDDSKESVPVEELGSTKKRIQHGDVVISRLRSYLRQIAVVRTSDEIPAVGSSEFFVLRPLDGISPDLLMVFLRSAPVQTILKYCQEGNQHPRFGEANLLEIPFPDLLLKHSKDITSHIQSSHAARQEAQSLLDRAKRAVEIAIEKGEPAALKFLKD